MWIFRNHSLVFIFLVNVSNKGRMGIKLGLKFWEILTEMPIFSFHIKYSRLKGG